MGNDNFRLTPLSESCRNCPLRGANHVRKQVPTEVHPKEGGGGLGIDVMFIAEAPGRHENNQGRPFIGATGLILRQLVRHLNGGSEQGVAYGNIVRCRTIDAEGKDCPASAHEISSCKANILKDIQRVKPKRIVLLGRAAALALGKNFKTGAPLEGVKISQLRGYEVGVHLPDGKVIPAIPTFHFAYVSRSPVNGSLLEEDTKRAFMAARGQTSNYRDRGRPAVIIDTIPKLKKLLKHMLFGLTKDQIVALDYETESYHRIDNPLLTIGFAFEPDRGFVIPYRHQESPWTGTELSEVNRLMKKFFLHRNVSYRSLVPHNLKFESAITLDTFGVPLWRQPLEDTMLRAHALNENRQELIGKPRSAFGLKDLVEEWLGFTHYRDDDIAPTVAMVKSGQSSQTDLRSLAEYNAIDCYATLRLHQFQEEWAEVEGYAEDLKTLGLGLHGPVSMFAAYMERNGMRVSRSKLQALMHRNSPIVGRMREIEQKMKNLPTVQQANKMLLRSTGKAQGMKGIWGSQGEAPWIFHINKPKSQQALFIDILQLNTKLTRTGKPSIGKEFYKNNKGIPEVDLASEWKALSTLRNRYVDGTYKLLKYDPDMRDGRVRSSYNFHIAVTGRTSSSNPNLQNIPKGKTKVALAVKAMFDVAPGNIMICADYSQAEVRWLAEITNDRNLKAAFAAADAVVREFLAHPTKENYERILRKEGDFHRQTASQILGKPAVSITANERGQAKGVVFGLIYGMTVFGLAKRLDVSKEKAEEYQNTFLNQFPDARKWLGVTERRGFHDCKVFSPIRRCRHLVSGWLVNGENETIDILTPYGTKEVKTEIGKNKEYEDKVCRNAPVQGVASDVNLLACINIQRYIEENDKPWKLINIVHDSIIAEVPWPDAEEYVEVVNKIMTDPNILAPFGLETTVPFVADFTLGPDWGTQTDVSAEQCYRVVCEKCGASREESYRPKNKRCESCGSKEVRFELVQGPLKKVLRYLDHKYKFSHHWKK